MNDLDNKKKDDIPFQSDPFSVDVWERAYKNVGRPFEKKAFDSISASVDTSNLPTKVLTSQNATGKAPAQKKRDMEGYRAAERSRASMPKSTPTVTPPTPTPQKSYTSTQSYQPGQSDSSKPTNFFQMIENAFSGDVSNSFKNIGELFSNSFGDFQNKKPKPINVFLAVIFFLFLLILGILSSL